MKSLPPERDLATRKLLLQQRSAVLRELLALQLERTVEPMFSAADKLNEGGRWVRKHPALMGVLGAALLIWRPRGAMSVLSKGLGLWQTWLRIRPLVEKWLSRAEASRETGPGA
ncbi:MAG TPA: YqjK family protein [Aquabacterium sp.]|nr:YqjK family protein [Aquabacterium sp.]